MMNVKNIFFFFLVLSFSANAQLSGYLGKRFVVGYSNYFFPGLRGPGPNSSAPSDEASFTFNNVSCLNLEYVYKERKMVCMSGQYLRTGIAYDRGQNSDIFFSTSNGEYPYLNHSAKYGGDFSKPALLTSINLSLGVKTFKNGSLAPVGRYRKLEIVLFSETVKYDNTHFLVVDKDGYPGIDTAYTAGEGIYKYHNIGIALTFGRQRIFFDKVVLDYGLRFCYTPAVNAISLIAADGNTNDMSGIYKQAARLRLFREQLINIHIGIGFLAF